MGWASGTDVAIPIIKAIKRVVKDPKDKKKLYRAVLDALRDADWDTVDEATGIDPVFDELAEE